MIFLDPLQQEKKDTYLFPRRWLYIMLAGIFFVHLAMNAFVALKHQDFFLHDDGDEYMELALSFAEHNAMISEKNRYYEAPRNIPQHEAYRSLMLPFLGGCFIKIFREPFLALALFQAVVMTAFSMVMFLIGRKLGDGDPLPGFLAVLLLNLHPLFTIYSMRFSSELLFAFFMALLGLIILMRDSPQKYLLLGICGGLSAWVRPTSILLLPGLACCLCVLTWIREKRVCNRKCALHILLCSGAFILCILPNGLRNLHHFGTFNLTSYLGGYNLYLGCHRENLKAYQSRTGEEFLHHQTLAWNDAIAAVKGLPPTLSGNPAAQDKHLKEKAVEEIRTMGLGNFIFLEAAKGWHFIRPWPLAGAHQPLRFLLITLCECFLFLAGGLGIWQLRRRTDFLLIALLIFGTGFAAHAAVHVLMRHRVPFMDTFLILFAAYALAFLFRTWNRQKRSSDS